MNAPDPRLERGPSNPAIAAIVIAVCLAWAIVIGGGSLVALFQPANVSSQSADGDADDDGTSPSARLEPTAAASDAPRADTDSPILYVAEADHVLETIVSYRIDTQSVAAAAATDALVNAMTPSDLVTARADRRIYANGLGKQTTLTKIVATAQGVTVIFDGEPTREQLAALKEAAASLLTALGVPVRNYLVRSNTQAVDESMRFGTPLMLQITVTDPIQFKEADHAR